METVLKAIADWIKGILTAGIMSNLSGLFDDVNTQVGNIAQQVGTKPSSFEPRVFAMIEALSRNVVLPIAGIILTFIACYELIEMITQHNNMSCFGSRFLLAKPAGCKVAGCAHPHPFAQVHRLMIEPDWLMKDPPAGSFLPSLPSMLRQRHPSSLTEVG